jgi:DNA-binding transcriptional regulator GbsR (MarR family)
VTPARWQLDFVHRFGGLGSDVGAAPSVMHVVAWLVVCEPAEQSVAEIRAVTGLSAGAVSAATTALVVGGLVDRVALPGERRRYYRIAPNGWRRLLQRRLDETAKVREVADVALANGGEANERLRELRDFYAWFEENLSGLVGEGFPPLGPWRPASDDGPSRSVGRRAKRSAS